MYEPKVVIKVAGQSHDLAGEKLIWDYWGVLDSDNGAPDEIELTFWQVTFPSTEDVALPMSGPQHFDEAFDQGPLEWTVYADPIAQVIRLVIIPDPDSKDFTQQMRATWWVVQAICYRVMMSQRISKLMLGCHSQRRLREYDKWRREICALPVLV